MVKIVNKFSYDVAIWQIFLAMEDFMSKSFLFCSALDGGGAFHAEMLCCSAVTVLFELFHDDHTLFSPSRKWQPCNAIHQWTLPTQFPTVLVLGTKWRNLPSALYDSKNALFPSPRVFVILPRERSRSFHSSLQERVLSRRVGVGQTYLSFRNFMIPPLLSLEMFTKVC